MIARDQTAGDGEFLAQIPIFGGLPDAVLARVIDLAREVHVAPGGLIFAEGEPARSMFIVRQGELEICKRGRDGTEFCLATLQRGDCVELVRSCPSPAMEHARHQKQPHEIARIATRHLDSTIVVDRALGRHERIAPAVPQQQSSAARPEGIQICFLRVQCVPVLPVGRPRIAAHIKAAPVPISILAH